MAGCDKSPMVKIYGNDALSTRVAAFQKKAEEHKSKQKVNPFSQSGHVSGMTHPQWDKCDVNSTDQPKWDKNDPRYGKPAEGSKTDIRGKAAGVQISNEVLFLCEMIYQYGSPGPNDTAQITFGELFQIYTTISNKVVGILLRARKHGLLHFEGEMLYQRRDDDVLITLLKPISELVPNRVPIKRKHEDEEFMSALSPEDY